MIVAIDPGHGGNQPGAVRHGLRECDVNLAVARLIPPLLDGYETVLTRTADLSLGLWERAAIANKRGASCFVSLHCNSAVNEKAEGFEVFHYKGSKAGKSLASAIYESTKGLFDSKRGVKEASFVVLKHTDMPAALVEMGFISNPTEAVMLGKSEFQAELAKAISKGIKRFLAGR